MAQKIIARSLRVVLICGTGAMLVGCYAPQQNSVYCWAETQRMVLDEKWSRGPEMACAPMVVPGAMPGPVIGGGGGGHPGGGGGHPGGGGDPGGNGDPDDNGGGDPGNYPDVEANDGGVSIHYSSSGGPTIEAADGKVSIHW